LFRWFKRFLWLLVLTGIVGLIVYGFLPQPIPVDTEPVTRGTLSVVVAEDGKTRVRDRYVVSSPLAGRLHRIKLRAGDSISAPSAPIADNAIAGSHSHLTPANGNGHGNTTEPPAFTLGASAATELAVIDPIDPGLLDARQLAQAELRVKAADSLIDSATASRRKAEVALEWAMTDLDRRKALRGKGANTEQELVDAEMLVRVRTEELNAAKFAELTAQYERDLARAALLRSRPLNPDDRNPWQLRLPSPINGVVMRVIQENETIVQPGTPLLEVGDLRDLEVDIEVLSTDAVKIRPGQTVRLKHWGGDRTLTARVRLVEPSGFLKLSALGVEEQRVHVIANFEDPYVERPTLGDGYRVEAEIVIWEKNDVLKVPTGALFRESGSTNGDGHDLEKAANDNWAVYVIEGNIARKRRVEIGHRSGLEAEVLSGLRESDRVIIHPNDRIHDQVQVQPR
jgi:HlyD family secretion protein